LNLRRKYDTLKDRYNDLKSRDAGEQTFDSHSTLQSLDLAETSLNSQENTGVRPASRPRRPLPSRATRSSFPMTNNMDDDSMALDPPSLVISRKRPRRSAPEPLEGPPDGLDNPAVIERRRARVARFGIPRAQTSVRLDA